MIRSIIVFLLCIAVSTVADEQRFTVVDIIADSKENALVAWQLDIKHRGDIKIIAIENGDNKAFQKHLNYDKSALNKERLIVSSFTVDDSAANRGKQRLLRLHIQYPANAKPQLNIKSMAAASPGGQTVKLLVSYKTMEQKNKK